METTNIRLPLQCNHLSAATLIQNHHHYSCGNNGSAGGATPDEKLEYVQQQHQQKSSEPQRPHCRQAVSGDVQEYLSLVRVDQNNMKNMPKETQSLVRRTLSASWMSQANCSWIFLW